MLLSQLPISNKLLAALPRLDYQRMATALELVDLNAGDMLCEAGQPMTHVYFPNDALASLLMLVDATEVFAVALVGREGMLGAASAMGSSVSVARVSVLCAGTAMRMMVQDFVQVFQASEPVRAAALQFEQVLKSQIATTAACNRFHVIEARLARWLLMTRDRLSSDHFHLTHETLGNLLGVRRVGVTNAAHALKLKNLIDYSRGAIDIVDGPGLRAVACSCYRVLEGRHGIG